MPSANVITIHDAPRRVISFPADTEFGILVLYPPKIDQLILDDFISVRDLTLGPAKGEMEVPTNVLVGLKLSRAGLPNLRKSIIYGFDVINFEGLWDLAAEDIEAILEMSNLSSVRMERMANDRVLDVVAKLTELRHLDLSNSAITDEGLAKLGNLINLEELNLAGTAIDGSGLQALSGLKKLVRLDLSRTRLNDEALPFVTAFDSLDRLEVSYTKVTDVGLKVLKLMPSLQQIGIRETKVSPHIREVKNFKALRVPEQLDPALMSGYAGFTGKFFSFLESLNSGSNFVASPLSVFLILHMLAHGAAGATKEAFQAALYAGCGSLPSAEAATSLLRELEGLNETVKIWIANSIWLSSSFEINSDFEELVRQRYGAVFSAMHSDSSQALGILNKWAEDQTEGLLSDVFTEADTRSTMLLANVVYFKGLWLDPFSFDGTRPRDFFLASGRVKECKFMHTDGFFDYLSCPGFDCISLPYKGERVQMHFFLPQKNLTMLQSIDFLKVNWSRVFSELRKKEGRLALPKFKIDIEVDLTAAFEHLGLSILLSDEHCSLPGLSPPALDYKLYVAAAKQRAYLKVDENGTEAAAVTKLIMSVGGMPRENPDKFDLAFDRPFFFVLRDSITGLVLFNGVVENPEI